ncbi:MAG: 50S ribosomal protein L9 [Alphaproteobacteria bacterium]|nr:50S ribosomal protein L9 [Alphaproteobacteria bacterium]
MDVILLERVESLGSIGDVVKVKNGFARNYLLPQHKALLATDANKQRFERERAAIEARNEKAREAASTEASAIEGAVYILIRQAGETGQLYGSVSARDIAEAATEAGHPVERRHVQLNNPIKIIGMHEVSIRLHPEVTVKIQLNVARSPDEAERQARGENVIEAGLAADRAQADEQAQELAAAAAAANAERGPADE